MHSTNGKDLRSKSFPLVEYCLWLGGKADQP